MLQCEDANGSGVLFISKITGFGGKWTMEIILVEHRMEDDDALVRDLVD